MSVFNHNLAFRPILGGISIYNPQVNKIGTVGFIASAAGERWLVSCYHVLCRLQGAPFPGNEPIFQPDDASSHIALNSVERSNAALDCAAARVLDGVEASPAVLGLPSLNGWEEPQPNMRVIKSGRMTGITEGVIQAINGDKVQIGVLDGFPSTYSLSEEGDSGAVWISSKSLKMVALHNAGTTSGERLAFGTRIGAVLTALNLDLL